MLSLTPGFSRVCPGPHVYEPFQRFTGIPSGCIAPDGAADNSPQFQLREYVPKPTKPRMGRQKLGLPTMPLVFPRYTLNPELKILSTDTCIPKGCRPVATGVAQRNPWNVNSERQNPPSEAAETARCWFRMLSLTPGFKPGVQGFSKLRAVSTAYWPSGGMHSAGWRG